MVTQKKQIKKAKIRILAFALDETLPLDLKNNFKISDHLNLCGEAIRDIGFIPVGDLYVDKHNPDAIKIACLKEGVKPTAQEKEILLKHGIKAYSYELIKPALRAAAQGYEVEAVAYIAKLANGYKLEARSCAIKQSLGLDLGLIISDKDAIWAGTFTLNKARAFCVEENISSLDSKIRVLVCNSGNANACTGEAGKKADLQLRQYFANKLNIKPNQVLLASTGKIGVSLPVEKIISKLNAEADKSIEAFAQAILTTDTFMKISQDSHANFLGFAKGSGMIHPQMATMLSFIITDKKITGLDETQTKLFMQECLSASVHKSFNSITVDGDSSTNDMCILMNNLTGDEISKQEFKASLEELCQDLAYKIVADGEGLTKISKLSICSNLHDSIARELGRFILNSSLVKTALHGNDPNWGRIIAALGQYAAQEELDLDIAKVKLSIFDTVLFENGLNTTFDRDALIEKMKKAFEIDIVLELEGVELNTVTVFGNDLSYDYVRINAEYFT